MENYNEKIIKINKLMVEIQKKYFKLNNKTFSYLKGKTIEFEYKSYGRWAMGEIKRKLISNLYKDPLFVLQELTDSFNDYSAISKTNESSFLFSVAADTCQFVLDEFLVMEK